MRTAFSFAAILLASLAAASLAAQDATRQPTGDEILRRVRERYSTMTDYHFEHRLTVSVEQPNEKLKQYLKVDFELAATDARRSADAPEEASFPVSLTRCRMSAHSGTKSLLLVSDGKEAVLYKGELKQYKRAPTALRVIGGPTSATFFLLVNTFPFTSLVDAPFERVQLLRQERYLVGDREVNCDVIEARFQRKPLGAGGANRGDSVASLAGSSYLMFLAMHGLTEPVNERAASAEAARMEGDAVPLTMLLWVEPEESLVWKSELREPLVKKEDPQQIHSTLVITDSFRKIVRKGPLPDELFQFKAAEGDREVEKFGQP